ncbi:MAG: response regulator, partial [Cyanobacteria bacterium P01_A01_bin.135]
LIHEQTDTYCSELQRQILIATLQGERKTYDQLAEECGYSAKYVKQDVAPKLWQLLSQTVDEKVHKSNVRAVLEQKLRQASAADASPAKSPAGQSSVASPTSSAVPPVVSDTAALPVPTPIKLLSSANILLVDDQPKNLRLLSDLLEEQGYNVQQAISGAVALQAIALDQPDLILLDITMPEMDGYTVCQQLKANPASQDIPVIFISALDEAWDKVRAFSVGGVDYITKPFKVVEVLARVENQLKIQQLQQELKAQNAQLSRALQELQRLAAIDELTQVASRRRFDSYLHETWQHLSQSPAPITLMLIHVGNLSNTPAGAGGGAKGTAETVEAGERALQQVAQTIEQATAGAANLVGRYGTFIFGVILPRQLQGEMIAEAILSQIWGALKQPDVVISVGIAAAQPVADMMLDGLVTSCESALQEALKRDGNAVIAAPQPAQPVTT